MSKDRPKPMTDTEIRLSIGAQRADGDQVNRLALTALHWHKEADGAESRGRQYCLELAEKAQTIRELQAQAERLREGLRRTLLFADELINVEEHVIWEEPAEISLNETICEARALLSEDAPPTETEDQRISRFGHQGFGYFQEDGREVVTFRIEGRTYKLEVRHPLALAAEMLGVEADKRGTSLHIHHCPHGDWLVFFGEADRVVKMLAQEPSYPGAVLAALKAAREAPE